MDKHHLERVYIWKTMPLEKKGFSKQKFIFGINIGF